MTSSSVAYMAMTPFGWEHKATSFNETMVQRHMEALSRHVLYQGVRCDIYRITLHSAPTLVHTFTIPRPEEVKG